MAGVLMPTSSVGKTALRLGSIFLVAIICFAVVMWLTEPAVEPLVYNPSTIGPTLARHKIVSRDDLVTAAIQSGLRRTTDMKGVLEAITRVSQDEVQAEGWLADLDGDSIPIRAFVFSGGKLVSETKTFGERKDVTRALGLSDGSEENVRLVVRFPCRSGEIPRFIAVSPAGRFYIPPSSPCP